MLLTLYRAFHGFGQAKFAYGGSIFGTSQFTLLPQLPLKMMINLKVVEINPKIIISQHLSKYVTHSVQLRASVRCVGYQTRVVIKNTKVHKIVGCV